MSLSPNNLKRKRPLDTYAGKIGEALTKLVDAGVHDNTDFDVPNDAVDIAKWINWTDPQNLEEARFYKSFTSKKATELKNHIAKFLPESAAISFNRAVQEPNWHTSRPQFDREESLADRRREDIDNWLGNLTQALANACEKLAGEEPKVSHLIWRRVTREALCNSVLEKLSKHKRAAIVGASGMGKSFLARQLLHEQIKGNKTWLNAPKLEDGRIVPYSLIKLACDLLAFVIQSNRIVGDREQVYETMWAFFKEHPIDNLGNLDSATDHENPLDPYVGSNASELVKEVVTILRRSKTVENVAKGIAVLRTTMKVSPDAQPVTVVIDDIWSADSARAIWDAFLPRDRKAGGEWPVQLILTSQDRTVAAAGVRGPEAEAFLEKVTVYLDQDEGDRAKFAMDLVAAWGAPGEEDMTRKAAAKHIELFVQNQLADNGIQDLILPVLKSLGHHPLASAILASLWRKVEYRRGFWRELSQNPELVANRSFKDVTDDERSVEANINPDHATVPEALSRIVDAYLGEEDKSRYLDLILSRAGRREISLPVFEYYWRRVDRAGEKLSSSQNGDAYALEKFATFMLVQEVSGTFFLHDIHRTLINILIGDDEKKRRHRQLLEVAGLLDRNGSVQLDDSDFVVEGGHPDIVNSGRFRMRLRLLPDQFGDTAQDKDREVISEYFLDEVLYHATAQVEPNRTFSIEREFLSCFPFLQAQLDCERDD